VTIIEDTPDYQVIRTTSAAGFTNQVVLKPGPLLTAQTNAADLTAKAQAAIAANATFLALASPTNPQVLAQVQRLTRECSALIKLLLNDLNDTSGT
jgi:hypothetical protein